MKKLLHLFVIVLVAVSVVGCGSNNNVSVHDDLLNYANVEIQKVVGLEDSVAQSYESVSGNNYTDDPTMLNALENDIIPGSSKLIEAAKNIKPQTKELTDVHDIYISAINDQHDAFKTMVPALEKQNVDGITKANEKLDSAREKTRNYLDELEILADKNGVTFNKD